MDGVVFVSLRFDVEEAGARLYLLDSIAYGYLGQALARMQVHVNDGVKVK